jgi:hypothetical protein
MHAALQGAWQGFYALAIFYMAAAQAAGHAAACLWVRLPTSDTATSSAVMLVEQCFCC